MKVAVVGLGRLGAPLLATLAENGHRVTGVDMRPDIVEELSRGKSPVQEPGVDELLKRHGENISATQDHAAAVRASDATFVVVPTPSGPDGRFTAELVVRAIRQVIESIESESYHLVVITSTLMPGDVDRNVVPILEQAFGSQWTQRVGLCYNPVFIALGSVIRDLSHPDLVLIGESDARAGDVLSGIHRSICGDTVNIQRMSFVNAELAKIAVNQFVTSKISFATTLTRICHRLPGADVDVVTAAVGLDRRVGSEYLKGGLGYGGPCFPRDSIAFATIARNLGTPSTLAEATDASNRLVALEVVEIVRRALPPDGTVAILGLSYKPGTPVAEASQGLLICQELLGLGTSLVVHDPMAMVAAESILGDRVRYLESVTASIEEADLVVVATPWPEFEALPRHFASCVQPKTRTVLDCWRLFPADAFPKSVDYIPFGRHPRHL